MFVQGVDVLFLQFTISKTLERSASVHLLFAFEYVIQCSIIVSTFIKYGLSAFDTYMEGRWENKVSIAHCAYNIIPLLNCSPTWAFWLFDAHSEPALCSFQATLTAFISSCRESMCSTCSS